MNTGAIRDLRLAGSGLRASVAQAITGATLSYATDAVTDLTLTIEDPGLKLLDSGIFAERVGVRWRDLELVVARIDVTAGGAGLGGLEVACRSAHAERLKGRTGPLVMRNVSPSRFVAVEAAAVGATHIIQPSPSRPQVSRDTNDDDNIERPSSWSTFERLGEELGYHLFEVAGTIYFGQATWLIDRLPKVRADWLTGNANRRALAVPQVGRSIDAPRDVEVRSLELPPARTDARPGRALQLRNMPAFAGDYLIESTTWDMTDTGPLVVTAATPRNLEPQPPSAPDDHHDNGGGGSASSSSPSTGPSSTASAGGSGYIWPMAGRVSSEYGPRGGRTHHGIDIAAPTGTPIKAARSGRITVAGWVRGYGNAIYIDHGGGVTTRYAHLSRFGVRGGQVSRGQVIGYCGATGNATGPHLHFEVRRGGTSLNPRRVLP